MNVALLVTDVRYPLDANGSQIARELEVLGAIVELRRVPEGPRLYAFMPAPQGPAEDEMLVVVAGKGGPVEPTAGWLGRVCWHEVAGCEQVWQAGSARGPMTVAEFVKGTGNGDGRGEIQAGWIGLLVVGLGLFGVWGRIWSRTRR